MRQLQALALVVVAAAGARTAGTRTETESIREIRYVGDSTKVCLGDTLDGATVEKIIIAVNSGTQMKDYPATSLDDSEGRTCATIAAGKPSEGRVAYSFLSLADDASAPPDVVARKAFEFTAIESSELISCGTKTFKITPNSDHCIAGVEKDGKCYKVADDAEASDNCQGEHQQVFKYCQPDLQYFHQDDAEAQSLAYTGELTLGTGSTAGDVIVVVDDGVSFDVRVGSLTHGSGADVVMLDPLVPSASTYTACPVEDNFIQYSIDDLNVKGTHGADSSGYFQFGFSLTDRAPPTFRAVALPADGASGDGAAPVSIDCGALLAARGARCYGYAPGDPGSLLHLSYFDGEHNPRPHNTIIVEMTDTP